MTDIMPIAREAIEEEIDAETKNVEMKVEPKELETVKEEIEEEIVEPKGEKEQFVKPEPEPEVEISKRTGKPKRKLTDLQKENLRKARERSVARRKQLKEAKELERKTDKIKREQIKNERIAKMEKADEMLELKARLKLEAEQAGNWTEERLQGLIDKSIDKYIEKKKQMKPVPKAVVPPPRNPNAIGNVPMDPKYYMPTHSQNYYNQQWTQNQYQPPTQSNKDPTLAGLFGNYD